MKVPSPPSAASTAAVPPNAARIKRVVSCFLVSSSSLPPHRCVDLDRSSLRVAAFLRQSTMPTFPSHWAPCSGSLEAGETPREAACRELSEETNLPPPAAEAAVAPHHGLPVDVALRPDSTIRVYPFAVELPPNFELELQGTEHDRFEMVSVVALECLQPAVPALATAFHHATYGKYWNDLNKSFVPMDRIRAWASDRSSGATTMAENALLLIQGWCEELDGGGHLRASVAAAAVADRMVVMRPSMVAITNALRPIQLEQSTPAQMLQELRDESQRAVSQAADVVRELLLREEVPSPAPGRPQCYRVAVFSRSSTLVGVVRELRRGWGDDCLLEVTCSKSTPGDEGIQMAREVGGTCVDDATLLERFATGRGAFHAVLVGADCITEGEVYNKVGTHALARAANAAQVPVVCCGDRFKTWDDAFPPPLEDIFEGVPRDLFRRVVY